MASLTNTLLETTAVGTTNLAGIINANWSVLESIFNPALSSGDARYNLFWKCLTRNATLPASQARLEWDNTNTKAISRPTQAVLTYAATITVLTQGALCQYCALTGNVTVAFDTIAAGRTVELLLESDASSRTLTWPASIRWLGTAPTALAANKQLRVRFEMRTGAASGITASFSVEP